MKPNFLPVSARSFNNAYIVDVTPELAKAWLDAGRFNRTVNYETVERYVRQIQSGLWRRTHQGVAFTRENILIDGQHRLLAVMRTGVTVPMLVFVDEPIENFTFIDCGRNRSNLDMLRLGQRDNTLSTLHSSTLKAFLAGRGCQVANRWTSAELIPEYDKHQIAINFAVDIFRGVKDKKINDPTVRGVLARAYYHVPADRICDFALKLSHACPMSGGGPISSLALCLHSWGDRRENTRREIYIRCQQTFLAYLRNSNEASKIDVSGEIFPIPRETR